MSIITRDPETAAKEVFDLIILGGGIYGAMLCLEASLRGLRPLLIERDDFGEFTSFNSLRLIHGGFRYLQNFDLKRLMESVGERRFFLRNFPDLVKPFPCLMPLYGHGLHRPFILRIASLVYDILSRNRNQNVQSDRHIPPGRIVDSEETKEIFPSMNSEGLKGGVVWYDALAEDSQLLLMEILRLSAEYGTTALNYIEAIELLKTNNRVSGVRAIDHENSELCDFNSSIVINACGPWCRDLAGRFDRDEPDLFRSMLAWNVLLDRKPLSSDHGLGVVPNKPGSRTLFIVPWKGKLLAGTGHAPWLKNEKDPMPTREQIEGFLDDLNHAIPKLDVGLKDVLRVFPGLQSAKKTGGIDFAVREVILNHADHDGPRGLYSISGVKFTTARRVAEKTLKRIFPEKKVPNNLKTNIPRSHQKVGIDRGILDFDMPADFHDLKWEDALKT
ncbi:MAG: FAD-dependent oxidoreductase, partial [Candidatus Aminicenantes bacterium]|nr:FAD-dependent oxidoreductase [Candidatus Aminicenantes bacterium]NIT28872.1 FAD-dependent oxidoreductase [Candidatus Aminicenantes bacterium]